MADSYLYGFCPVCGAPGVQRERRPNGNDMCRSGHVYPSANAQPHSTHTLKFSDDEVFDALVAQVGKAEIIRMVRDYKQLENLYHNFTVEALPNSLTYKFLMQWEPKK